MLALLASALRNKWWKVWGAASRPAALLLAPVLVRQGDHVRRTTRVLPEAAGDRSGIEVAAEAGTPLRLLVLGESTAAGVGVMHQRDALGRRLACEIAQRSGRTVAWQVRARTGATASTTVRELVPRAGQGQDFVVVALGVNDTLRLRSPRRWRHRMMHLLAALQPHLAPTGRVVLAGVPDMSSFPALPRPLRTVLGWHARALDGELRTLAQGQANVLYAPSPKLSSEVFAADGFHPNVDAYAHWAQYIADCMAVQR